MKTLISWFARFDHLDALINDWLVSNSGLLLRVCMGVTLLELSLLKFFLGGSFVDAIASYMLTGGFLSVHVTTFIVVIVECITGLCFFNSRFLRLGVWLLLAQLVGALAPFVLLSGDLLGTLFIAPTLVMQYVGTEILLVMAGLFVAINWIKNQLTAERKEAWS